MKFFTLCYYFFRSLLLRGPFLHFKLLYTEWVFEKKLGIKTASFKTSSSPEFFHYQGAAYLPLLRILKELPPETKLFDFIDIGCGKGRVLFVAEYLGYTKLYGIEMAQELLLEAEKNLETYRFKKPGSEFHFIHQNALEYPYQNANTLYFLFNPFDARVLEQVLTRIKNVTSKETYFIYMNPLYKKVFSEKGIRVYKIIKSGFYTEAVIYRLGATT